MTLLLLQVPELGARGRLHRHEVGANQAALNNFLPLLRAELVESAAAPVESELLLLAEEVLTNIIKYADLPQEAVIEVSLRIQEGESELTFSDAGKAFDPLLEARRATLGLDSEAAAIGGLGVHLYTSLSDRQEYLRRNGRNILRLARSHDKPG